MGLKKYLIVIPFFYFIQTRIVLSINFLFQYFLEIVTSIIIFLVLFKPFYLDALTLFLFYYLAFISVYEIGYFINDTISTKYENKPNKRLDNKKSFLFIFFFIIIRLIFFILISFYLDLEHNYIWWFFYIFLILIFTLHNLLREIYYRIATFQILAFLRFIAPFFFILDFNYLLIICNIVALTYVPYRTLSYMSHRKISYRYISRNYLFRLLIFVLPTIFFIMILILKNNYH